MNNVLVLYSVTYTIATHPPKAAFNPAIAFFIVVSSEAPKEKDHYILCGCGYSKNHPYCDGDHWKKG